MSSCRYLYRQMYGRIRATFCFREDLRLMRPYRIAGESIDHVENGFIVLRDMEGFAGYGTACPMPEVTGETMDMTMQGLKMAAELLENADSNELGVLTRQLQSLLDDRPAARAAAEIALYDLRSRQEGVPLINLLGGPQITHMPTSVTIGIASEPESKEMLLAHLNNGFTVIKLKIGDNVERDIALVRKIREWAGYLFRLRVDVNQGYGPEEMSRFLDGTKGLEIELIEQPFPRPGMQTMRMLPENQRRICMADEDIISVDDAVTLAGDPAYEIWNVKLMKSGGISSAKDIGDIAAEAGVKLMWGCNDESRISIAAALHTAFSCKNTAYLDLDGAFDIAHDPARGGFIVEHGCLRLTDAPGLGIECDL